MMAEYLRRTTGLVALEECMVEGGNSMERTVVGRSIEIAEMDLGPPSDPRWD